MGPRNRDCRRPQTSGSYRRPRVIAAHPHCPTPALAGAASRASMIGVSAVIRIGASTRVRVSGRSSSRPSARAPKREQYATLTLFSKLRCNRCVNAAVTPPRLHACGLSSAFDCQTSQTMAVFAGGFLNLLDQRLGCIADLKPPRFGIFTFGRAAASMTSSAPMMPLRCSR